MSRSQTFTVLSLEDVAMLGASAGPRGRKTHEVVVWKCPLYSHTRALVCLRSQSCRKQAVLEPSSASRELFYQDGKVGWDKELLANPQSTLATALVPAHAHRPGEHQSLKDFHHW